VSVVIPAGAGCLPGWNLWWVHKPDHWELVYSSQFLCHQLACDCCCLMFVYVVAWLAVFIVECN